MSKKVSTAVSLAPEIYEKIAIIAKREERSKSNVANRLLREKLGQTVSANIPT